MVDGLSELPRKLAALAAQRRQVSGPAPVHRGAQRVGAAQGLVQEQRKREQIRGGAGGQSLGLFGRHVGLGADHVAGVGKRVSRTGGPDHPRDAEVGQARDPCGRGWMFGHQHVGRLDVAVDHAVSVGVGERIAQGDADPHHVAVRQPAVLKQYVERGAVDQFGDQVGALVVDRRLVQRHDARVGEPCRGARLSFEASATAGAVPARHPCPRKDLDRDLPVEPLVLSQPHGGEAAGAQATAQAVAAEHQRRVRRRPQIARHQRSTLGDLGRIGACRKRP